MRLPKSCAVACIDQQGECTQHGTGFKLHSRLPAGIIFFIQGIILLAPRPDRSPYLSKYAFALVGWRRMALLQFSTALVVRPF